MKIIINPKLSVEQNAAEYFEKAKLARKKMEGAKKALVISLQKLEAEEKSKTQALDKIHQDKERRDSIIHRKLEWFEKFRWFYSSEGFLVIGGRDSTTNEIIIKKHTDKNDIVFHTDMAGSPFFVIKAENKEPGETTLQEVADATLCFSRAWKLGLMTTPTFWVHPDQVSKQANSGEYVSKGAFIIRGKSNYITPMPNCAIGMMDDGKLMCASIAAVKKHCKKYLILAQGNEKPSDIARIIKKKLGGDIDEIIRIIPSGNMEIKQ
ncbi:MAG: NFACT RNA binding domain-containing protein [Candidatus Woesearchaeota archaeon]